MKEEFLAQIKAFAETDLASTPCYILVKHFVNDSRIEFPCPHDVFSRMQINVSGALIHDKELLQATITAYIKILNNLWTSLRNDYSFDNAKTMFLNAASKMTLTYQD